MKQFFLGFLFIFLNINIGINEAQIDLLPSFVGYYFVLKGLTNMSAHSEWFHKARTATCVMIVYSGILWLLTAIGVTVYLGAIDSILGLLATMLMLYISYYIAAGIVDTEEKNQWDLWGKKLMSLWKILAIVQILTRLLGTVAAWTAVELLLSVVLILAVVAFVLSVVFIVYLYRGWKVYEGCATGAVRICGDSSEETDQSE